MIKIRRFSAVLSAAALGAAAAFAAPKPVAVVKAFDDAWNGGRVEKVLALCADDVTVTFLPYPGAEQTFRGKEQVGAFARAQLAGFRVRSRDHVATGGQVNRKSEIANDAFRALGVDVVELEEEAQVEDGLIVRLKAVAAPASAAQIQSAVQEANKKLVREFIDAVFNRHDLGAVDRYLSPAYVERNPKPGEAADLAGFKQHLIAYFGAFPDFKVAVEDLIAEGDRVALRARFSGTQRGRFMGKPAGNRSFAQDGFHILRIADGRIVEHWGGMDTLSMADQLWPAPPAQKKKQ
jgi:predicted ester cyclase